MYFIINLHLIFLIIVRMAEKILETPQARSALGVPGTWDHQPVTRPKPSDKWVSDNPRGPSSGFPLHVA
jgi:hypothetical protein